MFSYLKGIVSPFVNVSISLLKLDNIPLWYMSQKKPASGNEIRVGVVGEDEPYIYGDCLKRNNLFM